MKRNLILIRRILMGQGLNEKSSPDLVTYHKYLCRDAGLITESGNLTDNGHEFVDFYHSETAWSRAMKRIVDCGFESVPLEIFKLVYAQEQQS